MFVFRKPATRYLIGIGALALMLASFAVTFAYCATRPETARTLSLQGRRPPRSPATSRMRLTPPRSLLTARKRPLRRERTFSGSRVSGWSGVFVLALRIAFGLLRARAAAPPQPRRAARAHWSRDSARCSSGSASAASSATANAALVRVPAVIGFFRPIVLMPVRALTGLSPEQLEAVVAHELGHIKRFDVAVNFVQVIAETLFFFHPAVWWLNKRIRADREDCCDDVAVAMSGGSVGYARALATMATLARCAALRDGRDRRPGGGARGAVVRRRGSSDVGARTAGVFTASLVLAAALIGRRRVARSRAVPRAAPQSVAGRTSRVGAAAGTPISNAGAGSLPRTAPRFPPQCRSRVPKTKPCARPTPHRRRNPRQPRTPAAARVADRTRSYIDAMKAAGIRRPRCR